MSTKKKVIVIVLACAALLLVGLAAFYVMGIPIPGSGVRVDTSFATRAHLKYHYNGKILDVTVTNPRDVAALRDMLTGYAYTDYPACMFNENVSIMLSDGRRSLTLLPCFCRDGEFAPENMRDRYIHVSRRQQKKFERIWRRYGLVLPGD